jgi:hypothetical protein
MPVVIWKQPSRRHATNISCLVAGSLSSAFRLRPRSGAIKNYIASYFCILPVLRNLCSVVPQQLLLLLTCRFSLVKCVYRRSDSSKTLQPITTIVMPFTVSSYRRFFISASGLNALSKVSGFPIPKNPAGFTPYSCRASVSFTCIGPSQQIPPPLPFRGSLTPADLLPCRRDLLVEHFVPWLLVFLSPSYLPISRNGRKGVRKAGQHVEVVKECDLAGSYFCLSRTYPAVDLCLLHFVGMRRLQREGEAFGMLCGRWRMTPSTRQTGRIMSRSRHSLSRCLYVLLLFHIK